MMFTMNPSVCFSIVCVSVYMFKQRVCLIVLLGFVALFQFGQMQTRGLRGSNRKRKC